MFTSDINIMSDSAVKKYELSKKEPGKYLMRSIVAGFFLVVAIILSNVTSALFYSTNPALGKFLNALLFPTAIILIVFVGGELFTGNNMTMAFGVYDKKCTWRMTARVWIISYIGNFIGSVILSYIFVKGGASAGIMTEYMRNVVAAKLEISPLQMVLRGVLCNFMVCIAVLVGVRMKTEIGKLVIMFLVIMSFVVAGFEHSIANMGTFSISYFLLGGLPMHLVLKSMFFVTMGNILGGAVLLAWPIKMMSIAD